MPLAGDELSDLQIIDLRTEFNNLTAELVAEDQRGVHRLGGPPIPFIDVNVGATDSRPHHLDDDVIRASNRVGDLYQLQTRLRAGLDQGLHRASLSGAAPHTSSC